MLRIKSINFDADGGFGFVYEQLAVNTIEPQTITVRKSNTPPDEGIHELIERIMPRLTKSAGIEIDQGGGFGRLEKLAFGSNDTGDYVDLIFAQPVKNFSHSSRLKFPRAYLRQEGAEEQLDMFPSDLDRDLKELQRRAKDMLLDHLAVSLVTELPQVFSNDKETATILMGAHTLVHGSVVPAKKSEQPEQNEMDSKIIRMTTPSTIPDVSF
ncbi:hypothetical protein OO185_02415 [Prosthecochloris sp. SCSIO W1102]|uniref:hypothetical protein n=1 Tax=Prosthecochloris sp. SCSIO W1102 TaxID=2992243 RepID=UPI00223DE63E|nr:hypothetical protein [Prosthecochloris sp. SCSIO W1102]UZJ39974.1 hypothetical protein OO185_02415 [Prosthecochloris sp. SCSIO W1102]